MTGDSLLGVSLGRPKPIAGNTPWAAKYAAELRRVVVEHAARAPRSVQRHLGPSELGLLCDRQVVGKMSGTPGTNHVSDPWASIVGTAMHSWMEGALASDNLRNGLRWLAEQKVRAELLPNNPGTADAYDAANTAVVDWKFLGKTTLDKLKRDGPPLKYRVQLKIYGAGYRALGLPVSRVVLAGFPRTAATLDGLYVWETEWREDDPELEWVIAQTEKREQVAELVSSGQLNIMDVPATPSDDECYFCNQFRPDGDGGCPGTKMLKGKRT